MLDSLLAVRPLIKDDLIEVSKIEQVSRPSLWTYAQFAGELENANSHPRVLIEEHVVIGYVIPWHIAGEIQIQNIVVAQQQRGRGLGELLLNQAILEGLNQGCTMGTLEVRKSNQPAIGLYKKYQFNVVGERVGYYQDGETALLMSLEPLDSAGKLDAYKTLIEKRANVLAKTHHLKK